MSKIVYSKRAKEEAIATLASKKLFGFDKDGVIVDIKELIFQNRLRGFTKYGIDFPYDPDVNYRLGGVSDKYNGGVNPILVFIALDRLYLEHQQTVSKNNFLKQLLDTDSAPEALDKLIAKYTTDSDMELANSIYWWDKGAFYNSDQSKAFVRPYKGAKEAIMSIARTGVRIAIITNTYLEDVVIRDLLIAGFSRSELSEFEIVHDAKKPSPNSINHVLEKFGLGKDDAVYVGDAVIDIRTAKSAGVSPVAVLSGMGSLDVLRREEPDVIIQDIISLNSLLRH
ncbi:MAG: HAD family hydrolase [Candidatus Micrarchaeaceae archaeon]